MKKNKEIAALFEQISHMLELLGADPFRVNAHARAARVIADYPKDLIAISEDKKALTSIQGIGAKTADKIREYAESGKIEEHEELRRRVPAGLLDVLEVPGLGPKTVKVMWEEAGVESIDDLRRIIEDGSIAELPRMGAKTIENIKEALAFQEHAGDRIPLGVALPIAEQIVEQMSRVKGVKQCAFAGSLRRGRDTIGDIDILVASSDGSSAHKAFTCMEGVQKVLASGKTKSSVRIERDGQQIQADLRVVPPTSWGAAMLYFTGSKEHNVKLRERAIKRKLTLNEYGLFPLDKESSPPQQRGVRPVASKKEEETYGRLELPWIPPELREDRGEVSDGYDPPELIEVSDIRSELHAHTTASDGAMAIEELAGHAKRLGFHTIAVTDHSQSQVIANGLSADRLLEHVEAVREADSKVKGIRILAGTEVDILASGALDYPDEVLQELDVVVASPHSALRQDSKKSTARLIKAIENPFVNILGHPTGRLIGRRDGMSPDIPRVAQAAAEHGVALEINAHWLRLDLRDSHVAAALEAGALIAIDCDVHKEEHFDHLRYGVITGRRGGLTAAGCVNTWTQRKLMDWLGSRRKAASKARAGTAGNRKKKSSRTKKKARRKPPR